MVMIFGIIYIVMAVMATLTLIAIGLVVAILQFWPIIMLFLIVMALNEYDKRQRKKI